MTATIYYTLSPAGQRDAALRSLNAAYSQSITGEITPDDLPLFAILPDGRIVTATYSLALKDIGVTTTRSHIGMDHRLELDVAPTQISEVITAIRKRMDADGQSIITRRAAAIAERRANYDKDIEYMQAHPDQQPPHKYDYSISYYLPDGNTRDSVTEKDAGLADHPYHAMARQRSVDHAARLDEERKRKEREEDVLTTTKTEYLAQWVHDHGDDSMRARFSDGLLCRRELMDAIATWELRALPGEYEYTTCQDDTHKCGYEDPIPCLDSESYSAWAELRAKLPSGTTHTFVRIMECTRRDDDDDGLTPHTAVKLDVPCGFRKDGSLKPLFRFQRMVKLS